VWNPPRLRRRHKAPASTPAAAGFGSRASTPSIGLDGRPADPGDSPVEALSDLEYSLSPAELQEVRRSIRSSLGLAATALDSPAQLEAALATLVRSLGGRGDPSVHRSPATLLAPEYWHVRIAGSNPTTAAALAGLIHRETLARGPLA
jgi:hypothetical protein